MKKIISILLLLAIALLLVGCEKIYACYGYTILYDESGNATQLYLHNNFNATVCYDIMTDSSGAQYVEINSIHDHDTKMYIPDNGYLEIDETKNKDAFDGYGIDCLRPSEQGENTYQGSRIVNLYYLDKEATQPVLLVTDEVEGVVCSDIIRPTQSMSGELYFVFSNGNGKYSTVFFDPENPSTILSEFPEDFAFTEIVQVVLGRVEFDDVKGSVEFGGASSIYPTKVVVHIGFNESKTYDILSGEDGKKYIAIETTGNEFIYLEFKRIERETGPNNTFVTYELQEAYLPKDIIK